MKADDKLIFYENAENAENDGLLSERTVIYVPIKSNKQWKCLTFLFAALTVLMLTWTFCGHSIIGWWHHPRTTNDVSFSFANYYGDHMVLQKSPSQANVWGWAKVSDIGSEVTITLSSSSNPSSAKEYKATVTVGPLADRAVWQTLLDPVDGSSESFTIVATLGQQKAQLNDVLFGDVWVCSGQSNMQLSVGSMYNASQELDQVANFPNIRLIYVAMIPSNKPEYELLGLTQPWALPTKETVQGFSAVCWLYGREVHQTVRYPIGLVLSCWGGTRAEAWSSPDALKKCPGPKSEPALTTQVDNADVTYSAAWWKNQTHIDPSSVKADLSTVAPDPNENSVLWNGMIHPLSNMTITGAIWYQGEANVGYRTDEYNCTFRAMIEDWRTNFNQFSHYQTSSQFAFGFMQLGPNHKETMNATQGFSDIRWHQTSDIGFTPNSRLLNVFMATAMDTEDFVHDIHPRDKITPAHRLALAGLNVAYKRSSIHSRGPTPTAVQSDADQNTLVVEYDWGQGDDYKIDVRAKFGFDVCCSSDGTTGCAMSGTANWHSANIVDFSDYTVTLSWKQCAGLFLTGVRYAWRETPCYYLSCPIYGLTTKLPATPFIYQGLITEKRTLL